jgi:hypothetical protein
MLHTSYLLLLKRRATEPEPPPPTGSAGSGLQPGGKRRISFHDVPDDDPAALNVMNATAALILALAAIGELD